VLLAGRDSEAESGATTTKQSFGVAGSSSATQQAVNPASALSPRETTILELVKGGDSNKHIARKLGIAEATVKCHVKAILRKINVRNRFDAAMWALRADGLQQRPAEPVAPPSGSARSASCRGAWRNARAPRTLPDFMSLSGRFASPVPTLEARYLAEDR
jgi:DNA-binding CsgD family transcriptional regulator